MADYENGGREDRLRRLEKTIYTLNGEPGLVERIHLLELSMQRLSYWVKFAVVLGAANLITQAPPVDHLLAKWLP